MCTENQIRSSDGWLDNSPLWIRCTAINVSI